MSKDNMLYDKELNINSIKEALERIMKDELDGIVIISDSEKLFGCYQGGDTQAYINAVDFIFKAMFSILNSNKDKNRPAFDYFMGAMYERWRYYFGDAYKAEMRLKESNSMVV